MEKMAHFFSFKTAKNGWIKKIQSWTHGILLLVTLLIAGFLRLYKISDYMTFLGDEGRDALVVYNILHGKLTLLGPTSSVGGFFLGPIYYYFMVPFLWFYNFDPVGAAIMVGLFGIATVWLTYKIGTEFFGETAGLLAGVLYAISPLVIAYSRSSWNPNLMPFFTLITLYVLYKAVAEKKILLLFISGLLFGIVMQLHYLATFVAVIIASYIVLTRVIWRDKKNTLQLASQIFKDYLFLFIGFIVGWLPFLAFEARHGFPNARSILNFVFHSQNVGGDGKFFDTIINVFFRLFGRLITKFPPPEQISLQEHTSVAIWYYLTLALGLCGIWFLYKRLVNEYKTKDKKLAQVILISVWFFMGIFLFGFYKKPIYDYYFGFMFPLPFLLVGLTLSSLLKTEFITKGLLKIISIIIIAVLIWINLQGISFRYAPNRQKDQVKQIANFVLSKTDGKPFNFALITLGNSDHGYRYFFRLANKEPVTILSPAVDPERVSVTDQLLIVCEEHNCKPLGHPLWEVAGFGRAEIVGEWQVSVVKVYKLTHYQGKE